MIAILAFSQRTESILDTQRSLMVEVELSAQKRESRTLMGKKGDLKRAREKVLLNISLISPTPTE
jgi:hypothetical protein